MTDFSGDTARGSVQDSSRADADRSWWSEPDPVELFAAGLELALRQLRVEVAGLRAERDGLRLEVEGLRAKLAIAHEQLASRDSLSGTVRQLQDAVARLTLGQAAPPPVAPVVVAAPAPAEPVIVLPAAPVAAPPAVVPVVEPVAIEPLAIEPVATPEPAAPSAIEQLKAMGLWPPKPAAAEPAAATFAPAAPSGSPTSDVQPHAPASALVEPESEPEPEPEPELRVSPYERVAPATPETVVNWDRLSTRRTPVVVDEGAARFDVPEADATTKKRGKLRLLATALLTVMGGLVVLTVLLVSVGPRLLPYQTYFVRSGSMEPTISTGAMVVLTKIDGAKLEPGDVITFKNPENDSVLVTHRIIEIETTDQGRVFVTKGDANDQPDSWRVPASGTGWKYAFDVPVIGYVFGYLGTPQARLALLVIPAAILGLLALLDIWRPKDSS